MPAHRAPGRTAGLQPQRTVGSQGVWKSQVKNAAGTQAAFGNLWLPLNPGYFSGAEGVPAGTPSVGTVTVVVVGTVTGC